MSSGVMAALQILVLPVKVRILARQLKVEERPATLSNRFFYLKFGEKLQIAQIKQIVVRKFCSQGCGFVQMRGESCESVSIGCLHPYNFELDMYYLLNL